MKDYSASFSFSRSQLACTIAALTVVSISTQTNAAQDEDNPVRAMTEITVTGSRIANSNYAAPNPVSSLTGDELERLGIVNVADALTTQFAQNLSNYQPTNTGMGSFFIGSTIANLRGLNPDFGSRTLTLINGRRVVSTSNQADVVDMNIIPSNLLQRMDVVTGGASAAYGSGAVSGVVNLMLDDRMEGVSLDMDYGRTSRGDGTNRHIALSGGTSIMSGRGHILLGGEWQDQAAILDCAGARSWCGLGRGLVTNNAGGGFAATPGTPITPFPEFVGLPHRFYAENLGMSQFSPNGVIAVNDAEVTHGWRFTEDGTDIERYELGVRGGANPGSTVINGDGPVAGRNRTLMPENDRRTLFGRFEYEISERLTAYVEGNYAKTQGMNLQWPTQRYACVRMGSPATPPVDISEFLGQPPGTTIVPGSPAVPGNAYLGTLSPEAQAQLTAAASAMTPGGFGMFAGNAPLASSGASQDQLGCVDSANLYKVWNPQILQETFNESETVRGVFGMKGSIGNTWTWDGYYQYGRTETLSRQQHAMTDWRYSFALDSILDPCEDSPTFGQPVCRVSVDGVPTANWYGEPLDVDPRLAEGCRPINPFGATTANTDGLAYAFRELVSAGETRLDVLALNTSGEVWEGWGAGPLTAAVGFEYRRDEVNNQGSQAEAFERVDFPFPWADAFGGKTSVMEEYIELNMPLIKDVPLINMWSINGAVRHADYRNQGGVGTTGESGRQSTTNWKLSTSWQPVDWARLRATRSRDLRAAGYRELYFNQLSAPDSQTMSNLWRPNDPDNPVIRNDPAATRMLGNPNLKPETSDTLTFGLVLSPGGWAQGMRFSVDYYRIRIKDGLINTFGSPVQLCWEQSGNSDPVPNPNAPSGPPLEPGVNGLFDPNNEHCQQIHFGDPDPRFGDNQYSNILFTDNSFSNNAPFLTRGIDFAWDYAFPLASLYEPLPGMLSLRISANHAIESTGTNVWLGDTIIDAVGQLGAGGFLPGIQPTPEWSGNFIISYLQGPAAVTLSARYVGSGRIDTTTPYAGPSDPGYRDEEGNFLIGSISSNRVPSYLNFSLNASYSLQLLGMEQLQLWGSVSNLFDRDPPFTGGFMMAGVNPMFHDTLGRNFRVGFRSRF